MKHGLALIISQTSSGSAGMMEHLQRAHWDTAVAAPDQAVASAIVHLPSAIVICGCDRSTAGQMVETLKLNRKTAGIRIIVCGQWFENDSDVQILPDAQTDVDEAALNTILTKASTSARCELNFRVPNNCRFIEALTTRLNRLYEQFHIDGETNHRLMTAVREMVHNAIEWGNRGVADASVLVVCRIEPDSVVIRVRDSGAGFNREVLPHAANSQDPTRHLHVRDALGLRAGGFGILMTRGLVDELSYNDAGNEVQIVKKITTL